MTVKKFNKVILTTRKTKFKRINFENTKNQTKLQYDSIKNEFPQYITTWLDSEEENTENKLLILELKKHEKQLSIMRKEIFNLNNEIFHQKAIVSSISDTIEKIVNSSKKENREIITAEEERERQNVKMKLGALKYFENLKRINK